MEIGMTRSERLLGLLQELRNRRLPATATTLGAIFGVSERTIYRDIATLNRQGAVIDGAAGLGYVLRDDFFLPPLAFDAGEAAAILLGLRFALRRGDGALAASAASARSKLVAVLPALFDDAASTACPLLVAPPAGQQATALGIVRDALARERKLRIHYVSLDGGRSERVVWPVAIGWFDEVELLAAWCETRGAFRTFRVDRIGRAETVDERPPRSRRLLLDDYRALEPLIAL
jgi:predicted DNA-binding transcriptional regulator YafY